MLDPLTAVSLASAIVQLTDFGIRLVEGGIRVYQSADGLQADHSDLDTRVTQLRELTARVIVTDDQSEDSFSNIKFFARSCHSIASELLAVLDALRVRKPAGIGRKWESFQKAVEAQTPRNKDKIASLEKRLKNARQGMFNEITLMMSERQSRLHSTLADLADNKLLEIRDDILETIKDAVTPQDVAISKLITQLSSLAEATRDQKILAILNSLDFDVRKLRQSDIADTESRTFEWIFHHHHGSQNQRIGLKEWLISGNDIFWISGKPGSGKSVLMNFIAHHAITQELLRRWAGDTDLIIAKYFFWNAGAPMQKSQLGLLQSLLREIYGQCPELLPIACPRWSRHFDIGAPWSRFELLKALKELRQIQSMRLKFCFFIDGVDEYEGDHADIVQVLKTLNKSPFVKICLSSRPWNIFIEAFGTNNDQRLQLEDHNGYDIRTYISSRFEGDERFIALESRDPRSSGLVDQIVRNAQGVFLWVRIVVGNLLRGITNEDNLADLHRRLDSFPTDLTAYFEHMFDTIDEFYRKETAEILLICLTAFQPLSLLTLWFYEKERTNSDYASKTNSIPLQKADIVTIYERIQKRINARGQDLLTIESDPSQEQHLMYTVGFCHRTVKDFLVQPCMVSKLNSWRSGGFNPHVSLCKATLAGIKSSSLSTGRTLEWWNFVKDFLFYVSQFEATNDKLAITLIEEIQLTSSRYLSSARNDDEFNQIAEKLDHPFWSLYRWSDCVEQSDRRPGEPIAILYCFLFDQDMTKFFFALAIVASLRNFIKTRLMAKPTLINQSFAYRPPLDRALRPPPPGVSFTSDISSETVQLLLESGADPNGLLTVTSEPKLSPVYDSDSGYAWTTVWALFLNGLHVAKVIKMNKPPEVIEQEFIAAKLMIEHGAAASLRPWRILPFEERFGSRALTPSDIFHEVFLPHQALLLDQLLQRRRPWVLHRICSCLRRTIMLWFYRNIQNTVWLLKALYPVAFNDLFGVIFPLVYIPVGLYWIWLALPFTISLLSVAAPFLLPVIVLSDWIPMRDVLMWCNDSFFYYKKVFRSKSKAD
ncbi:hypothetical protein ACLMJK_004295 [Lecanora helva]